MVNLIIPIVVKVALIAANEFVSLFDLGETTLRFDGGGCRLRGNELFIDLDPGTYLGLNLFLMISIGLEPWLHSLLV